MSMILQNNYARCFRVRGVMTMKRFAISIFRTLTFAWIWWNINPGAYTRKLLVSSELHSSKSRLSKSWQMLFPSSRSVVPCSCERSSVHCDHKLPDSSASQVHTSFVKLHLCVHGLVSYRSSWQPSGIKMIK